MLLNQLLLYIVTMSLFSNSFIIQYRKVDLNSQFVVANKFGLYILKKPILIKLHAATRNRNF